MIVLDIETSGKYTTGYGVWQIGALDYETGEEFIEEGRIDEEDIVSNEALQIIGKTEEDLRNKDKQSQEQLIKNFIAWAKKYNERIIAGHNVWWDFIFLQNKCIKYGLIKELDEVFGHRVLDLSSIAQFYHKQKFGKFKTEKGKNSMNLPAVMEMCGMQDNRRKIIDGKITEGNPHNALEDVKLTEKCFRSLLK